MNKKFLEKSEKIGKVLLAFSYLLLANILLIGVLLYVNFPSVPVMMIIISLASFSLIPSYSASMRLVSKNEYGISEFIRYYKDNFFSGAIYSVLMVFVLLLFRLNVVSYADKSLILSLVFELLSIIWMMLMFNIAVLIMRFYFPIKTYFVLSLFYFKRFALASLIMTVLVYVAFLYLPYNAVILLSVLLPLHYSLVKDDLLYIQKQHIEDKA